SKSTITTIAISPIPISSNVLLVNLVAPSVSNNTVQSEIPVAKTTSVPHGIFFCTSDHVYIPYLGNNIIATANIVTVVESNGCNIPSVAHNVNKLIDITIKRHSRIDIL